MSSIPRETRDEQGRKWCPGHKDWLNPDDFHKDPSTLDGLHGKCEHCVLVERRKRHWKNPKKRLFTNAQMRAKRQGTLFDITLDDIEIPEICPILGISFEFRQPEDDIVKGPSPGSPSLDKIDPDKGYIQGNIQVISHLANTMKCNATPDELLVG